MAIILNIDSAFNECFVALGSNEEVIAHEQSAVQKDHASFIQPGIQKMCNEASVKLSAINAVAVSNGPGSYTGLRVGLSSAKGICYALKKPLILLNTLDIIAYSLQQNMHPQPYDLICPMIDARRMEVFTALYTSQLKLIKNYTSLVLNPEFLLEEKQTHKIIAGGNGCEKLKTIPGFENFIYSESGYTINHLISLAFFAYKSGNFSNLAYSEPFYLKQAYIK